MIDADLGTEQIWNRWSRAFTEQAVRKRFPVLSAIGSRMMREARIFRLPDEFYLRAGLDLGQADAVHDPRIVRAMDMALSDAGNEGGIIRAFVEVADQFVLPFQTTALLAPSTLIFMKKIQDPDVTASSGARLVEVGWVNGATTVNLKSDVTPGITGRYLTFQIGRDGRQSMGFADSGEPIHSIAMTGIFDVDLMDYDPDRPEGMCDPETERQWGTRSTVWEMVAIDESRRLRRLYAMGKPTESKLGEMPVPDFDGAAFDDVSDKTGLWGEAVFRTRASFAQEVMVAIQQPRTFIIEIDAKTQPKRKPKKRKSVAAPPSERPVYLSLSPKTIRRYVGLPDPEPGSKSRRASHERRAHLRRLKSERYTWKRGQTVAVKASWIGPASGTTNDGRSYRVRLDIASPAIVGKSDTIDPTEATGSG